MRRKSGNRLGTGRPALLLAVGALLAGCGSDETGSSTASAAGASIAIADAPRFAAAPGAIGGGGSAMIGTVQPVIGKWRERLITAEGTINAAEYRRIAGT